MAFILFYTPNVGNYLHRARSDRCLVRWLVAATPVCKPILKIQKSLAVVSSRKVNNARLDNFFVPTVMHDSDQSQRKLPCRCRASLLPQIEKIFQPPPQNGWLIFFVFYLLLISFFLFLFYTFMSIWAFIWGDRPQLIYYIVFYFLTETGMWDTFRFSVPVYLPHYNFT